MGDEPEAGEGVGSDEGAVEGPGGAGWTGGGNGKGTV